MNFLTELSAHIAGFRDTLRHRRAYADVLHVEVAQDIAADIAAQQGRVGRLAYTAQQSDLEARQLLDRVLADGRITPAEVPLLRTARRHVLRSAERNHQITEACA